MIDGPRYWMHETSGVLAPVVKAYLDGETLTGEQVAIMRAYLRQWIMAGIWDANPHKGGEAQLTALRDSVKSLHDRASIDRWINEAVELGVDPL